MNLFWQNQSAPAELHPMLRTLGAAYPIRRGSGRGTQMVFEKTDSPGVCRVDIQEGTARIRYSTPAQAGRALGALLSGLVPPDKPYSEATPFATLGIMLDCSRNAVITVEHMRRWMNRLALLGYNMVMLYTEDTYELPGEPWFGYQRGPYTRAELLAMAEYAASLNIEMVPCIQTLGHLEKILRHRAYADVKDTSSVLLVGEPKTYALIEKMLRLWSEVSRTRRIHIGMDETHDLGRGRYMDLHGYRRGFDLFNEHLAKVVRLCRSCGLRPMIWSDMYFRLGSKTGDYYDPACAIPRDVIAHIPPAAELVYWDYYHREKAFYLDWIRRHRQIGKEPLMGSGIWTWNKLWYDHRTTAATAGPCIEACREAKIREIFFTQWGDNGAYCDHDSAFAGMAWCADKSYGSDDPDPARLEKRFTAVCGGSYSAHILAADIHGSAHGFQPSMWDDPILDTHFRTFAKDSPRRMADIAGRYSALARRLRSHAGDRKTGDLRHAYNTAAALAARYALSAELLAAYRKRDRRALAGIRARIPKVAARVRTMEESFRRMWLSHNKPLGLETIQSRFGMIEARYRELSRRLGEYLRGDIRAIPELDCPCPPQGK